MFFKKRADRQTKKKTVLHDHYGWEDLPNERDREGGGQNLCEKKNEQKMECAYVSLSIGIFSPKQRRKRAFFNLMSCWHSSVVGVVTFGLK